MQHVKLEVPALPEYARGVRMLAANLAVLANFSYDDIDDCTSIAAEAFNYALETSEEKVEISFDVEQDELRMQCTLGGATPEIADDRLRLMHMFWETMADEYEVTDSTLTLVKKGVTGEQ